MSSFMTITQVIDEACRIDLRVPHRGWDGYLVIEPRTEFDGYLSLYITREKAAELRDLIDEALAEPAADESADEASIAPPRIPEPGLWGVVEAGVGGISRFRFVHAEDGSWYSLRGSQRRWDELLDPVLIREGLS